MQKTMKLISILLMVVMICFTLSTVAKAAPNVDSIVGIMDNQTANGAENVASIGGQIADIITTVGIVVAVIVILILGIKYMMGSAEEKADYKKSMIPYLVGAVLIFAASTITGIVYDMAMALNGSGQ